MSDNETHEYGELKVTLTNQYNWVWDDSGEGGDTDTTMWRAKPQNGMCPLGVTGWPNYDNINGRVATLLIGSSSTANADKPPCAFPTGFEQIWDDKGTGGKHDGACWRPKPPAGYVALGEQWSDGYNAPPTTSMYCVREDLVERAEYDTTRFWDDWHKGARRDISLWYVKPGHMEAGGSERLPMISGTFRASNDYSKPNYHLALLPVLKVSKDFTPISARPPPLTKDHIPKTGDTFDNVKQADVKLPFTFFVPWDHRRFNDFIKDPFVSLSKTSSWIVIFRQVNDTDKTQPHEDTTTLGVSSTQSHEFQLSVGASITASAGIDSSYVSDNLNYQFTSTDSHSFTQYKEHVQKDTFQVKAHSALVVYAEDSTFQGSQGATKSILGSINYKQNRDYYLQSVDLI